jgi:hypothetical protein
VEQFSLTHPFCSHNIERHCACVCVNVTHQREEGRYQWLCTTTIKGVFIWEEVRLTLSPLHTQRGRDNAHTYCKQYAHYILPTLLLVSVAVCVYDSHFAHFIPSICPLTYTHARFISPISTRSSICKFVLSTHAQIILFLFCNRYSLVLLSTI